MSECSEAEVVDLDNPATVEQTVRTLQSTVKLELTFVNIFHSLREIQTDRFKIYVPRSATRVNK